MRQHLRSAGPHIFELHLLTRAPILRCATLAEMIILYSSFLIDVQGSYQSGYTQLQVSAC